MRLALAQIPDADGEPVSLVRRKSQLEQLVLSLDIAAVDLRTAAPDVHPERAERQVETAAGRLDKALLECPETVKALVSAELRQTVQIADLLAVEKAACYIAPALIAVVLPMTM